MKTRSEHTLVVSPSGECEAELFTPISREINRVYGFPVHITPLLQDLDFALDEERGQYHSTLILEKLAGRAPSSAVKVLAVTHVDLFIPILTHVYGEAQLGGKACIVSTYRLKENLSPLHAGSAYAARVVKEAIHELGHTFNLHHCPDPKCIMHYCRSVGDVDRKSDLFCRYCQVLVDDELRRMARK